MEDLNNFVDETGKKLGLSEDGIAKAKEELIAAINKRDEQYQTRMERSTRKIRHDMAIEQLKRQFACSHRKGVLTFMPEYRTPGESNEQKEDNYNKFLPKLPPFQFDFAVIKHTNPNGQEWIKCMLCNRKWVNTDPDFSEANKMVQYSTNKPSSSEVLLRMPLPMMPQGAPVIAATLHKGFWSRFFEALNDHFKPNKGITEKNISVEYHDKL